MKQLDTIFSEVLALPANMIEQDVAMEHVDRWDSLKHMELITTLEDAFSFQFTMDEIAYMRSTGKIRETVTAKVQ